jgi:tripartite-type tricarboxylate transporter receptor subunit TctC
MKKILVLLLALFLSNAYAKTYKVFIGTSAGSTSDVMTRMIFDKVSKETGDTFVIINKPGAALLVSYQAFLAESKNDPNVILYSVAQMVVPSYITNPELKTDPLNEIKGLTMLQKIHYQLVVRSDSKINTVKDIKGKLNIGSTNKMSDLLFQREFPVGDFATIAYKSENETITALLKGEIDIANGHTINTLVKVHQDKLKVLRPYPDVVSVHGYSVATNFPEEERRRLGKIISNIILSPEISNWILNTTGIPAEGGTGERYDKFILDYKRAAFELFK